MKRFLCVLLFLSCEGNTVNGEFLDRMVAVVDGHIITASDMRQEREILMRLGDKPIDDDKALVRQMIDNYLIETSIANYPGVDATGSEVDAELQKSVVRVGAPSRAVREAVRLRLRMRKYFNLEFAQDIRVSDEDIRKYYNEVFKPAAIQRGLDAIPPIEQVTDQIRSNIFQERLNHEIDIWLEAIHRRSNVEVFE